MNDISTGESDVAQEETLERSESRKIGVGAGATLWWQCQCDNECVEKEVIGPITINQEGSQPFNSRLAAYCDFT